MAILLKSALLSLGVCAGVSFAADGNPGRASQDDFAAFSGKPAAAAPAGMTRYLHLEGSVQGADSGVLLKELDDAFLAPLRQRPPAALFSATDQAGPGRVGLNLILEPASPADAGAIDAYIARLQAQGFHGLPVVFQKVSRIVLNTSLQIGMYAPSAEDAFVMHDEVAARASFSSIAAWLAADNAMGFGVIAKKHGDFEEFVRRFVGDPVKFDDIRRRYLPVNNMIELATKTSVQLPGGAVAGPMLDTGPFLPFTFIRDCFDARFENGMCSGSPARAPEPKLSEALDPKLLPPAGQRWN